MLIKIIKVEEISVPLLTYTLFLLVTSSTLSALPYFISYMHTVLEKSSLRPGIHLLLKKLLNAKRFTRYMLELYYKLYNQ